MKHKNLFFKNNNLLFCLSCLMSVIVTIEMLGFAYLLQQLLDIATQQDVEKFMPFIGKSVAFLVILAVSNYIYIKLKCTFAKRAMLQYKDETFNTLMQKNVGSFMKENTSAYVSTFTNDITSIEANYLEGTFKIISMITSFVGAVTMMFYYNLTLSLITCGLCMILMVVSGTIGKKLTPLARNVSDKNEIFVNQIQDLLSGFSVIKNFQAEEEGIRLFKAENQTLENAKFSMKLTEGNVQNISMQTSFMIQIVMFLVGIYLTITGQITIGVVVAFVQLMNNIMSPIQSLPVLFANRKAAIALVDKLVSYTESTDEETGTLVLEDVVDNISLSNITFGYEPDKTILRDINVNFEKGKKYAIVGASGSGKSTLVNLLLKTHLGYEGEINFANKELKDITYDSLSQAISTVQQNVIVFNTNIKDNITMFKNYDDAVIEKAVQLSGLKRLVDEKGYDYVCGENGVNLSGGEKQRISIARALLKNTSIMLMDEATSALDAETATSILNQMLKIENLLSIVITHNLNKNILEKFDEIIVMQKGNIVEVGAFDDLLEKKDYFYSLYNILEAS
ncbi:MAG: hypothetical protein ATN35_04490 [Epulopiscium sp. Nele67-Bin004]|nr:MAG: hypothetical protein ATN35_04490 [Epulopiscium sp. Nele67-Bin004]